MAPWGHVWYTSPKGTFVGLSGLLDNELPVLLFLPLWCSEQHPPLLTEGERAPGGRLSLPANSTGLWQTPTRKPGEQIMERTPKRKKQTASYPRTIKNKPNRWVENSHIQTAWETVLAWGQGRERPPAPPLEAAPAPPPGPGIRPEPSSPQSGRRLETPGACRCTGGRAVRGSVNPLTTTVLPQSRHWSFPNLTKRSGAPEPQA